MSHTINYVQYILQCIQISMITIYFLSSIKFIFWHSKNFAPPIAITSFMVISEFIKGTI